MLQQISVFDNQITFLGVCLTRDRVPLDLKKHIASNAKHVPCFLITKESIEVKSRKEIIVHAVSQDTIQLSHPSFNEVLTIVGRNGKGYVFISTNQEQPTRRSSDPNPIPQSTIFGIFNYFCRVLEDDNQDEEEEANDFSDDDDFEMMFSSKTSPFVGSFVDSFINSVPISV